MQEPKQISETNLGGLTVLKGYGAEDVRAVKENLKNSGVQTEYRESTSSGDLRELGGIDLRGTLDPGTAHLYGPVWYNAGDEINISISWIPATSTFRIGLTSRDTGIFSGCEVRGGTGSCKLRVTTAGYYYPTVWNVGPDRAAYSGFVSW